MLNILVTGADGQLGSEMRLLSEGATDRYLFTDVAQLDITDATAVRACVEQNRVDVIVNCAAYTDVDRAEDDEATAELLNRRAVEHLATAAAACGATLIHVSTDYVFGGTPLNTPIGEEAVCKPTGIYGRTKLAGEQAVKASGCRHLIFRTAWLYSEFGKNFVKTMIRLTGEREALKVVFDQTGTPTHAADLARTIFDLIGTGRYAGHEGIYHFSNEGVCSWYDFAVEIARLAGHDSCRIDPCRNDEFPSKVTRPAYSVLDKTKVKRTFGITIPHWRASLARCMERLNNVK